MKKKYGKTLKKYRKKLQKHSPAYGVLIINRKLQSKLLVKLLEAAIMEDLHGKIQKGVE